MKIWTAHEKPLAAPVLLREGFSFGAFFFGPFWLAASRAWIPAAATLSAAVLILAVTAPPASTILLGGYALLLGFSGRDLVRWSWHLRGYAETHVLAGRDEDEARLRLFDARPDLVAREMTAEDLVR